MQILKTHLSREADELNVYVQFLDRDLRNATILEPGRVAYLGESSNFPLLVDPDPDEEWVVHYQLPESFMNSRAKLSRMDGFEFNLLRQKGALSLLPCRMCDDLVDSFFRCVAPALPIIHRDHFMAQYRDPNNPPSLLLLQAIFLAASTVTRTGSQVTGKELYGRVKALYDSGYEDNRVIIVQALVLIGWYCEKSGVPLEQILYWHGLATTIALGAGIHRSAAKSPISLVHRRLWRRIYWTLYIRDRSMSLLGQVVQIHTGDCDVEMICTDDFAGNEYPPDPTHISFFIHWVKLYILFDNMILLQGTAPSRTRHASTVASTVDFGVLLAAWLKSRPKELKWEETGYNSLSALLHCCYQAVVTSLNKKRAISLSLV